jgi:hypothetical protein
MYPFPEYAAYVVAGVAALEGAANDLAEVEDADDGAVFAPASDERRGAFSAHPREPLLDGVLCLRGCDPLAVSCRGADLGKLGDVCAFGGSEE